MLTSRPAPALPRRALGGILALPALALAGCSRDAGTEAPADPAQELLSAHDLDGLGAREIIDRLEALPLPERPQDLLASVLPESLSLSDAAGTEISLPLPDGEFYVSIAPFVEATHECVMHSLTTCLGELQEQELEVSVTTADGEVLLDEVRATAPNGFLGLWLPRDQELTVTLAREGASASGPLLTDAEAPTCVTTMQLDA